MTLHEKQRRPSRCTVCTQTVSERHGTMFEGLRTPIDLAIMVVTLLSSGYPVQALYLDECAVADGRDRAGQHVDEAIVEQETLERLSRRMRSG